MSFTNIKQYVDALVTDGKYQISSIRKVPSQATTAGHWVDLSMAGGNPLPNYYASSPLTATTLDGNKGIYHGANQSPSNKYLRSLVLCTPTAAAVPSNWILCDYLIYYPFIDMDTAGEDQLLDNSVTLPRYTTGEGVMAILVNQTPTVGGGTFTFTYTNSAGETGRVSPTQVCKAATALNIATLTTGGPAAATNSIAPFLSLQGGDKGIRSVQSINWSVSNGGLCALVLVKPLINTSIRETLSPSEVEAIVNSPKLINIKDGAYLNLIGCTPTGSIAAGTFSGYADFVWE